MKNIAIVGIFGLRRIYGTGNVVEEDQEMSMIPFHPAAAREADDLVEALRKVSADLDACDTIVAKYRFGAVAPTPAVADALEDVVSGLAVAMDALKSAEALLSDALAVAEEEAIGADNRPLFYRGV